GVDVVVAYFRPSEGLIGEHLYDDEFVVCASAKHRLADCKGVTMADVAQERWALGDPASISQRWLLDQFREAGLPPPNIAFQSRSLALKQRTIACSDMLTFTSRSVFRQLAPDSAVKILPVKELRWPWPVSAVYRRQTSLPPVARRFIDVIKATAKAMRLPG